MKNLMIKLFILTGLSLLNTNLQAQEESPISLLKISNPSQSIGIHIGDVLHRQVELVATQPYQLSPNSLPTKGSNNNGIELAEIKVSNSKSSDKTVYKIDLTYQVFAHSAAPTVMQLPAESFAFSGGSAALSINLPVWRFWFAPLVAGTIDIAKQNLQPQQKPTLVDVSQYQIRFALFVACLLIAAVGLVYMNADRRWLPYMGGAFSQAYRQLKRAAKTPANPKNALLHLHEAFNKVYGASLFATDIDRFIAKHPQYGNLKKDIESFFDSSNKSLFTEQKNDQAAYLQQLLIFSKQLRDCERGV